MYRHVRRFTLAQEIIIGIFGTQNVSPNHGGLRGYYIHQEGKPLDPGKLRGRFHYKACEKAKLRRVRIHDLRHSSATIRISAGHNIADVSRQLGHASIKITVGRYYQWILNQHTGEISELDEIGKPPTIRNQEKKRLTASPLTP